MNAIVRWFVERKIRAAVERLFEVALGRPLSRKERHMLKAMFLENWATTLLGFLGAIVRLHQGGMNWQTAAQSAAIAGLGVILKDAIPGIPTGKAATP